MHQKQRDGVTPELRATRTADPANELKKSLASRDLRFLGVAGFGLMVPGVPGGSVLNPIVSIRGVHIIEGTSDFIQSTEHGQLQPIAYKYAEKYNHLLFTHLLRINDSSIAQARQKIDKELLRMERSDPMRDATRAVQKAPPLVFIELPDGTHPGIDSKAIETVEQADELGGVFGYAPWPDVFIAEIMTPLQRRRLAQQVKCYIVPYNRYLFAHWQSVMEKQHERLRKAEAKLHG